MSEILVLPEQCMRCNYHMIYLPFDKDKIQLRCLRCSPITEYEIDYIKVLKRVNK